MATYMHDQDAGDRLAELDAREREAWQAYKDRLAELGGREYEDAEHGSWAVLQTTLRDIHDERADLAPVPESG